MLSKLSALQRPAALLAVAALLPIIVFATAVAVWSLQQQASTLESDGIERARRLSEMVDRVLATQIELARGFAELPIFDSEVDIQRFDAAVARLQSQQPLWLTMTVLD